MGVSRHGCWSASSSRGFALAGDHGMRGQAKVVREEQMFWGHGCSRIDQ